MEFILHESIIPYLNSKFALKSQIIKATVLHAASIGESVIDEKIEDLEQFANPTVGLLAHPGQVDIRVTAKAGSVYEALELSKPIIEELKLRLGENIYGQDDETLEGIVCQLLNQQKTKLSLFEYGLNGTLISRLKLGQPSHLTTQILEEPPKSLEDFEHQLQTHVQNAGCDICFGVALILNEKVNVYFVYQDHQKKVSKTRSYGGPRGYAPLWVQNIALDFLRRQLLDHNETIETGES